MFHYFFIPLVEEFNFLNLFNYITFRGWGIIYSIPNIYFFGQKLIGILKKNSKKRSTNS